jgi:hypothetical protein
VQITRSGTIPFDDTQVAAKALRDAGHDCDRAAGKSA